MYPEGCTSTSTRCVPIVSSRAARPPATAPVTVAWTITAERQPARDCLVRVAFDDELQDLRASARQDCGLGLTAGSGPSTSPPRVLRWRPPRRGCDREPASTTRRQPPAQAPREPPPCSAAQSSHRGCS